MNTHADKTQEQNNQSVAKSASQQPNRAGTAFPFVDNRPQATAQRQLQEMANSSPRVMYLQGLRDIMNPTSPPRRPPLSSPMHTPAALPGAFNSGGHPPTTHPTGNAGIHSASDPSTQPPAPQPLHAPVSLPRSESTAPAQLIGPKEKKYIQKKVTHKTHGAGTIIAIAGTTYEVAFDKDNKNNNNNNNNKTRKIPARELDLVAATPAPSDQQDTNALTLTGGGYQLHLTLESDKTWTMELLHAETNVLATVKAISQHEVLNYIQRKNRITATQYNKPTHGTFYELQDSPTLRGVLLDRYRTKSKETEFQATFESFAESRRSDLINNNNNNNIRDHSTVMGRLGELHEAKLQTETGHVSIQFTKIKLDNPIRLFVGGKKRTITHLYTQPGNSNEIRCYLGTDEGAYQRVHTSLTTDKSAHTMVQTGETVAVPQIRAGGTRIGFDTKEDEKNPGFAVRELKLRSEKKCTVTDWIESQAFNELSKEQRDGCLLLANRFNNALDLVCVDIMRGKANERSVTGITSAFKILDDKWLFGEDKSATPERELKHHQETGMLGESREKDSKKETRERRSSSQDIIIRDTSLDPVSDMD